MNQKNIESEKIEIDPLLIMTMTTRVKLYCLRRGLTQQPDDV